MIDSPSPVADSVSALAQHDDGLTVHWHDGQKSFFHYIWLRDCCYCELCGDSYSSNRFLVPSDLPLDVTAHSVALQSDGQIEVIWAPDGHVSHYHPDWLRRHRYDEGARQSRLHRPTIWDEAIQTQLPKVSFQAASGGDEGRLELYRRLRDFGFVVVEGGQPEPGCAAAAASLVGELGDSAYTTVFDLTPSNRLPNIGNSTRPLPPHTDEAFRYSPPGINVLGCVEPAADGGDTILVDGFHIGEALRRDDPDAFALLAGSAHVFHRHHPGQLHQSARVRMFALDDRGRIAGVRVHTRASGPMDLPAALVKPFYRAHQKLCRLMLSPHNQVRIALRAGDSVLIDNHRVLHSRTAFTDPKRFVQICNVSREDFHGRLRLLALELGHLQEANQVLGAGMAT